MIKKKFNFTKATLDTLPLPANGKRAYYYDNKMRGLGISLTSKGTKTFIVYRWISGRPERVTLGRYPDLSIEQARGEAGKVNSLIATGTNPNSIRQAARKEITLGELFAEYLAKHAKLHKRTWKEDEEQFKRYLDQWSKRKLSTIKKQDIQKLHHSIGQEKGFYAANRLLSLFSALFNKGIEFGSWDKINPAHGIKKFKELSRDRFLQNDELPRFFEALAQEPNDSIRDYILLSLLTGARRGNVQAMKWKEINFVRSEWHIPQTKNGTSQIVTLSQEAIKILEQRKINADNQYVFPGHGKLGHLVEPKKGWSRILQRAGITNLRIHDLRRTLGSWQAKTGASLVIIGKSLNHKSPSATAIYARLDLDPVREAIEKATKAMLTAGEINPIADEVS